MLYKPKKEEFTTYELFYNDQLLVEGLSLVHIICNVTLL